MRIGIIGGWGESDARVRAEAHPRGIRGILPLLGRSLGMARHPSGSVKG
jgi:hypothetical protein